MRRSQARPTSPCFLLLPASSLLQNLSLNTSGNSLCVAKSGPIQQGQAEANYGP